MKAVQFLVLLSLVFCLANCAYNSRVDLAPVPIPPQEDPKARVLVLPFSSYVLKNYAIWQRVNLTFYEALTSKFLVEGILGVPFEDILKELETQGKIERGKRSVKVSSDLVALYQEDWSPLMKEEIGHLIAREVRQQIPKQKPPQLAFEEKEIIALGEKFHAKYVIRGRITAYNIRQEDTLNPFKIGFLTAQNRALARFFYGAPESGAYGTAQEASVGGLIGAIVGSNAKDPFEPPHKKTVHVGHPLLGETYTKYTGGTEDYDLANALTWGAAGMLISYLGAHGGNAPEAVVGLSLYVYDVEKETLIWENRVRLRVSPQSIWAPRQSEDLLIQAVEEAAKELASRFGADVGLTRLASLAR